MKLVERPSEPVKCNVTRISREIGVLFVERLIITTIKEAGGFRQDSTVIPASGRVRSQVSIMHWLSFSRGLILCFRKFKDTKFLRSIARMSDWPTP